jgi:hypothetical protein
MVEVRDCLGRLTCICNETSGMVEVAYKGCLTKTVLEIGGTIEITRQGITTRVTRISDTAFDIQSIAIAA